MIHNNIIDYWFNNDYNIWRTWWFNKTKDNEIYKYFYDNLLNFDFNNIDLDNPDDVIKNILLLDQISRNINRIKKMDIDFYTKQACILSQKWIENKYYNTKPFAMTAFAFLPFRHMNDKLKVKETLDIINKISINNIIYDKFKKAKERFLNN